MHHVYLIPGFFGFSNLGEVQYFRAVRETLERHFESRGEPVKIFGVRTYPTGSLRKRGRRVIETIFENDSVATADHIHLVGHSTGGIDARLVASLTRDLGHDAMRAKLNEKLRTVVTVAAPHYGTPLANFFTTLYGKKLLYFITLLVVVGLWRRPVSAAAGLLGLGFRVYDLLGLNEPMLRQITNQLLRDFTPEREREVRAFLSSI
ncbi:MAG: esterase/lipase family protein, partial [Polyangiales bacterium]